MTAPQSLRLKRKEKKKSTDSVPSPLQKGTLRTRQEGPAAANATRYSMSKILPPPAAASLLTLVFVLVLQITGLFCFAEGQFSCPPGSRMEYVRNGRSSSSVPFDSGCLELEFVFLDLSGKKHFTYFYIRDDENNRIKVRVKEKANILEEVKMWFHKTGWISANETEEKKTLKFGTIKRALFHLSEDVFNVTLWDASDDGSHKTWSHSNPPVKMQRDLTIEASVPSSSLFHWLSCPPPHTYQPPSSPYTRPPSTPPTSTEPQDADPSPTFGACTSSPYFYLVVAAFVVIFLIPLVLYIQLKRDIRSQKARDESNKVQNYETEDYYEEPKVLNYETQDYYEEPKVQNNETQDYYEEPKVQNYETQDYYEEPKVQNYETQDYYEELDSTQIPVAPPLHQR